MTAHVFHRAPGELLCVTCSKPEHCSNCDEGIQPFESHRYRNVATGRWEFSCVRKEPLESTPSEIEHDEVVHVVPPVRRRISGW